MSLVPAVDPENISLAKSVFNATLPENCTLNGVAAIRTLTAFIWSISVTTSATQPQATFETEVEPDFVQMRRLFATAKPLNAVLKDIVCLGIDIPSGIFTRWQITFYVRNNG